MEGNRALNYILGLLVALALSVGLVFIMAIIIYFAYFDKRFMLKIAYCNKRF